MAGIEEIKSMVEERKCGTSSGMYSICSSHPFVIRASIREAAEDESVLLIEATSNQVNQYGGYTGMTPESFRDFVFSTAKEEGFPSGRIILGGDHLGPTPFKNESFEEAMGKSREMVKEFVRAGFSKIHLDTSIPLGDDPGRSSGFIEPELVAGRCADLCIACEEACGDIGNVREAPVYVIGTEVPVPGGSDEVEGEVHVTDAKDFENTVSMTKDAFYRMGLEEAWERVVAVVVQPGVEFGDHSILEYNRDRAFALSNRLREYDNIVFEAHSTDYQTPGAMKQMVEDGFAILKVGPGLTYAFREAVYLLSLVEKELSSSTGAFQPSYIMETADRVMKKNPVYWENYYKGNEAEKAFMRKFSFFDRIRYYWNDSELRSAFELLLKNLSSVEIPPGLLSQFLPAQYMKIRAGRLTGSPEVLIIDRVRDVVSRYAYAAGCLKQESRNF